MQIMKRTLAILMVIAMAVACLPTVGLTAFAAESGGTATLVWDADDSALTDGYDLSGSVSGAAKDYDTAAAVISAKNGVSGSKALAYSKEGTQKNQAQNFNLKSNVAGFVSAAFSETDVLWFWVDAHLSSDRLLHVQLNGSHLGMHYIYTIVADENGAPAISQLDYDASGLTEGDGLALIASAGNAASNATYARIRLENGWYGWIGIPVANFNGNGSSVPTGSVSQIVFRLAGAKGTVGDTVYFDEFWMTSADTMPALSDSALLYRKPMSVWNQENNTKEVNQESIYSAANEEKNGPRNNSLMTNIYGFGVGGSMAMKFEATEAGDVMKAVKDADGSTIYRSITNTNNISKWSDYGVANPTAQAGDIFWLWIDAALSTTQRFTFQLNGKDVLIQEGETYIYTIVNKDGKPAMEKIMYSADHHNATDSVDGIDLINANTNDTDAKAQIRISKDWSGWIGLPIDFLGLVGAQLTKCGLLLNQYSCEDPIENQQIGDAVYMDEFWLTAADTMPALSDELLLYVGQASANEEIPTHQTAIWDQESNSAPVNITGTHASRNDSMVTDISGFGVQGSTALKYEATEANTVTETKSGIDRSITQTVKVTWASLGGNNATVQASDDIFWMWIDASMSTTQRFTFQLNGEDVDVSEDTYIYTIVNKDGKPAIEKIPYSSDPVNPEDGIVGIDLVNSQGYTNAAKTAHIRLDANYSGWIGLPMDQLGIAPGTELSYFSLLLNQYSTEADIADQQVGDAIYMDEFWLTSAGLMPDLSDAALLYVCNGNVGFDNLYNNGMIFQQNKAWKVSGSGEANATVTVKLINAAGTAVQTKTCTVVNGKWSVAFEPVVGSYEVYSIEASDGNASKTLTNVVFGEVWVAGGQSNMDYTINQTAGNVNDEYAPGIAEAFGSIQDVADLKARLETAGSNAQFIRMYLQDKVDADLEAEHTQAAGRWSNGSVWDDVLQSSALAFYYAEQLQKELEVPVGIIETPKGGTSIVTWMDEDVLSQQNEDGSYKYKDMYALAQLSSSLTSTTAATRVGAYYNTRIAPFAGYEVKGILWYQGENDRNTPDMQRYGVEVMVESWSKIFTMDPANASDTALDFVVFQIAPFIGYPTDGVYPDADLMTNTALNAAMREGFGKVQENGGDVVIIPIYDLSTVVDNHHPLNKLDVATRAIQVVFETYYSANDNIYSGPAVTKVEFGSDKIVLTFDQAIQYIQLTETDNQRINPKGGYTLPDAAELWGDKLNGFSIYTGSEYVSVENAVIVGNTVELTVPAGVTDIAGVAYAYGVEVLSANLYDMDGNPALPFEAFVEGYNENVQIPLWSVDDLNDGDVIGTLDNAANTHSLDSSVLANAGVLGSNAMALTLTEIISGKTASETLTVDLTKVGFDTSVQIKDEQILWFWMDSDLSCDVRLHMLVNGNRMRAVDGDKIYTIAADKNGNPTIVEVPWQFDAMSNDIDGIDGLTYTHYLTSSGNTNTFSRIKLSNGWAGWVGVPLNSFKESKTAVNDGDTITEIKLQLYKNNNAAYDEGAWELGSALYLDEFWVTSAGKLPALSNEALLYTEAEQEQVSVDIKQWNLTLGDNIGLNFYSKLPVTAQITVNGASKTVETKQENGSYVYSVDIAATQMTDEVSVTLTLGKQSVTKTYTVRQYADYILNGDYPEATKELVKQMLNYGAAAQQYFGHNDKSLANDGITVETVEIDSAAAPDMVIEGAVDGVQCYGATLVLRSRVAVRVYFTGNLEGCTVTCGDAALTPVKSGDLYYVEIADIAPQMLNASVQVRIAKGEQVLTVAYSPMNYMVRMSVKGGDTLKALLKAMYNYHLAAVEFVK